MGVWGPAYDCVYAWSDQNLVRWDGKRWLPVPVPGPMVLLYGTSTTNLVAVGERGLISRWDGSAWSNVRFHDRQDFVSVHVVDEQETWIVGLGGSLVDTARRRSRRTR